MCVSCKAGIEFAVLVDDAPSQRLKFRILLMKLTMEHSRRELFRLETQQCRTRSKCGGVLVGKLNGDTDHGDKLAQAGAAMKSRSGIRKVRRERREFFPSSPREMER